MRTKELTHSFTNRSVVAVEVDFLDVVVVGVAPVHGVGRVVEREAVGPQHVGRNEDLTVGSVHPRLLDSTSAVDELIFLPVGPVHPSEEPNEKCYLNVIQHKR